MKRLALVGLAIALLGAGSGSAASPSAEGSAAHEAQRLLDAYHPPPGAVRVRAVPKGVHAPAPALGGLFAKHVVRHRIWRVHLPAKAFRRYFFHRLYGWHAVSYGTVRAPKGRGVDRVTATLVATGFGGRATGRMLNLLAVKTAAGWSILRADVAVVWHLSASELEYLPAGVKEIDIRGPDAKARVTAASQVRTIVRWFDHLPLAEAPVSCGAITQHVLTFTFRDRHGTVARMSVPSGGCSPARYMLPRQWQRGLVAGDIDRRVQKLLGVKLLR